MHVMHSEEKLQMLERVGKLYQRYGIKSVTMDDVARELGISKKTLYQYVSDKTDLVSQVIDLQIADADGCIRAVINREMNAIEELLALNRHINQMLKEINPYMEYDLHKYYPPVYERLNVMRRDRMYDHILQNLLKGKKEGLYRQELDEKIIARFYVSRMERAAYNEMLSLEELTSEKHFNELFVYHIRGIANETGILFLENNYESLIREEIQ